MSFSKKNIINFEFFFSKKLICFFGIIFFRPRTQKLSDYCLPGRLLAGKSAAKKLKKYKFYFFKTYIFWRAGRWKIGGKKNEKSIRFFYLYFLEGWSLENRRPKKPEQNISFSLKKHIFFGGLVAGKSPAKKMKKSKFFFQKKHIFWRAGRRKIGGKKTEKYKFYF